MTTAASAEGFGRTTVCHADQASPEVLLSRLEGIQKAGNGWRALCPACGGQSRKVSIAEADGRVLLHAFCGCPAETILAKVGLGWADLMPPQHWPKTREDRESARRAMREVGLVSAVEVLALEACVIEAAGRQFEQAQCLTVEDDARLSLAVQRVTDARLILCRPQAWRTTA
jgi:hypothetical protein